jgi:hypothetical protein
LCPEGNTRDIHTVIASRELACAPGFCACPCRHSQVQHFETMHKSDCGCGFSLVAGGSMFACRAGDHCQGPPPPHPQGADQRIRAGSVAESALRPHEVPCGHRNRTSSHGVNAGGLRRSAGRHGWCGRLHRVGTPGPVVGSRSSRVARFSSGRPSSCRRLVNARRPPVPVPGGHPLRPYCGSVRATRSGRRVRTPVPAPAPSVPTGCRAALRGRR